MNVKIKTHLFYTTVAFPMILTLKKKTYFLITRMIFLQRYQFFPWVPQDLCFPVLLPSSEMKKQAPYIHPLHGATLEPGAMGMVFGTGLDTTFVPFSLAFVPLCSRSATEQEPVPPRLVLSVICISCAPQKGLLEVKSDSRGLAIWHLHSSQTGYFPTFLRKLPFCIPL